MPQKSAEGSNSFGKELISLLTEENAHAGFDAAVKNFPADLRGKRPPGSTPLGLSTCRTSSYRSMGHRRIRSQPQSQISEFPRWLLAEIARTSRRESLGQIHRFVPRRPEKTGQSSENTQHIRPNPEREQPITGLQGHSAP